MKNKLFIAIIIIIIIIIGMYLVFKNPSVQVPTVQEQAQTQSSSTKNITSQMKEMPGKEITAGSESSSSAKKISKYIVNYTNNGFSPPSLQIKVGQTVQFVNKSGFGMWVASGPHPTHTDYPGFDEKRTVSNGGMYEFTFTKVGVWGYHNHVNPSKSGSIIVK